MRKIRLAIAVILMTMTGATTAQVKDAQVESLMTKRVLTCEDIYYNSITLIPELYRAHKYDTVDAVVEYWQKNCGMNEASVAYTILRSIENNIFREELQNIYKNPSAGSKSAGQQYYKNHIITYLTSNYNFYNLQYYKDNYTHFSYAAYVEYSNFIRSYAGTLLDKPGLTPVEHFLVDYYAEPDVRKINKLADSAYLGTITQQAYKRRDNFGGGSYGLSVGMWHPTSKLAFIGDHPYFGFFIGGRGGGFSCDIVMNIALGTAQNYYFTRKDDSTYKTNNFSQIYIGTDFGQALFRTKHHEVAILAGVGWDILSVLSITDDKNAKNTVTKDLNAFNLNVGLGYKFYIGHKRTDNIIRHSYLGLQAKYNFVNYNNDGGTDLKGNTVTIGLTWAGYHRNLTNYYNRKK